MAYCQDIGEAVVDEDKVDIDIVACRNLSVAVALFGHLELEEVDPCWRWIRDLLHHWLDIGLALDSFDFEAAEEEDMDDSMEEESRSLDRKVACHLKACSFLAPCAAKVADEAILLQPTLEVVAAVEVEASRTLQNQAVVSVHMAHPTAKDVEEASLANEDQAHALRKD